MGSQILIDSYYHRVSGVALFKAKVPAGTSVRYQASDRVDYQSLNLCASQY